MSRIKVKVLNQDCIPQRTHRWDAGWDLRAAEDVVIPENQTKKIHTGVIMEIPPRHCGMVVPRSSLGTKFRITLANDVGIIDSEYRGEIMVFLSNDGNQPYEIKKGERFAQLVIVQINSSELWVVDKLSSTGRGDGGFGSTTQSVVDNPNNDGTAVWGEDEVPMDEVKLNTEYTDDSGDFGEQPKNDLTDQAKELSSKADRMAMAELKREQALTEIKKLKPAEYTKLLKSGNLYDEYPMATGNMKEDLGIE
jgi:dUTP pyrophosphatase